MYSWLGTMRNVSVPVNAAIRSHTSSIDLLRTSVPLISRISSPACENDLADEDCFKLHWNSRCGKLYRVKCFRALYQCIFSLGGRGGIEKRNVVKRFEDFVDNRKALGYSTLSKCCWGEVLLPLMFNDSQSYTCI